MTIKPFKATASCLVDTTKLRSFEAMYFIGTTQTLHQKTALIHLIRPVEFTPFTVATNVIGASHVLHYSAKMANGDPIPSFLII
jgi:hypothetical protein